MQFKNCLVSIHMKKFFLISLGLLALVIASLFIFFKAEPPPAPLIPAPQDLQAASELQAAIDKDYCATAQQILTQSSFAVTNEIHLNFDSFVKSKPSADPVTTHQFLHYLPVKVNAKEQAFPAIVSCKLKTAERINHSHANANAGSDLSCRHLLERDVNSILSSLDKESLAFEAENIVFREDEMANQGRTWLAPWPYAVARMDGGMLVWQSKAMLISYSSWNPMPARFLGTHYCHLPTPQYIRGILVGDIKTFVEPVDR
jgi:hypothetical protein